MDFWPYGSLPIPSVNKEVYSKPQSNLSGHLHQVGAALCSSPWYGNTKEQTINQQNSPTSHLLVTDNAWWVQTLVSPPESRLGLPTSAVPCTRSSTALRTAVVACRCFLWLQLHLGSLKKKGFGSFFTSVWKCRRTGLPSLLCCACVEGSKSVWGKKG